MDGSQKFQSQKIICDKIFKFKSRGVDSDKYICGNCGADFDSLIDIYKHQDKCLK